jgi:DNA polymerase-3 subunit delta'
MWPQLAHLADGSVRAALQLATGGIELHERVEQFFSRLPALDWPALHSLADTLTADAQQQRYEMFFTLLLDQLARLVRTGASGRGSPGEVALAARLILPARQPAWAGLWQAIQRDKADVEALNLDRKALIVRTFARIEAASRG